MAVSLFDVLSLLSRVDRGTLSLAELDEFVVRQAWEPDPDTDRDAADLLARIELLLAEFSSGHRTEDELRNRLGDLRAPIRAALGLAPARNKRLITTSTALTTCVTFA